ncbi:unnamed protein product, partial [marine sediment metagenome]
MPYAKIESSGCGIFIGKSTLTGEGTLATIGSFLRYAKATLSGTGTLSAIGSFLRYGKASLSGTGTLATIGRGIFAGKATLSGVGTLTAIGQVVYGLVSITPSPASAIGSVVAPTVIEGTLVSVQRGLISLEGSEIEKEVSLDTPVPVGKSFIIASSRSARSECYYNLAKVELTTI